jgi:hypothetical protein
MIMQANELTCEQVHVEVGIILEVHRSLLTKGDVMPMPSITDPTGKGAKNPCAMKAANPCNVLLWEQCQNLVGDDSRQCMA